MLQDNVIPRRKYARKRLHAAKFAITEEWRVTCIKCTTVSGYRKEEYEILIRVNDNEMVPTRND